MGRNEADAERSTPYDILLINAKYELICYPNSLSLTMTEYLIYKILLITVFTLAVIVFPTLLFIPAPYGRHNRPGWGPWISARLGWVIMESFAVIVFILCFAFGNRKASVVPLLFLIMWLSHYGHRAYVYPLRMRAREKQMPVLIMLLALTYNIINGYLNGRYLFSFAPDYPFSWIKDPRFIAGILLFVAGFAINVHSDGVLRSLRTAGESGYKIPRRGFFKYVSSANYSGEIVEWCGWALATWSLPGLAFALFTIANLVPRARFHHEWYRRKFPDYPPKRKALIPFLY
jgi:3-oxo-5-alpha-steroid 4-dehydrogenase 1